MLHVNPSLLVGLRVSMVGTLVYDEGDLNLRILLLSFLIALVKMLREIIVLNLTILANMF